MKERKILLGSLVLQSPYQLQILKVHFIPYPIKVFKEVSTGEVLEYIATAENGWNAVKVGTQVGWVSGEYSKKTE